MRGVLGDFKLRTSMGSERRRSAAAFGRPLHRLVRGATGFPCPRALGHSGEHVWPVVESGGIEVRAIRPNKRMNLWVQPNLIEDLRVTERPKK